MEKELKFSDVILMRLYEGNGLFAKIIDAPAEEALKHGFELKDIKDQNITSFYEEALDALDWDETAITALKWARLFGGSIAVMLIDDGRGLDEPLDWQNIKSVEDIVVYDRSIIRPDYSTMLTYSPEDPFCICGSRLGMPEYYNVFSRYGTFTVHESRCLIFRNGVLPENTANSEYQIWGMPEFYKLQKALSKTELAHGYAVRLLERAHQTIYKIHRLSERVATDEGADIIQRQLELISLTSSILNSIAIDQNDDYVSRNINLTGVKDIIKSAYNHLSAVSSIPQKILGDIEEKGHIWSKYESQEKAWQNYIEGLQARMLYSNLRYLLAVIFQAGANLQKIKAVPKIKICFQSMRNLSGLEKAQVDGAKAKAQLNKARAAQTYVNIGSLSPSEVRKGLESIDCFDVATLIKKKG